MACWRTIGANFFIIRGAATNMAVIPAAITAVEPMSSHFFRRDIPDVRADARHLGRVLDGQVRELVREETEELDDELGLARGIDLVEHTVDQRVLLRVPPAGDVQGDPVVRLGRRALAVEAVAPVFELGVVRAEREARPVVAILDEALLTALQRC